MIRALFAVLVVGQLITRADSRLVWMPSKSRTWLVISCAPHRLASCDMTDPPHRVTFGAYPDDSQICRGSVNADAEQCVSYGEFKAWLSER